MKQGTEHLSNRTSPRNTQRGSVVRAKVERQGQQQKERKEKEGRCSVSFSPTPSDFLRNNWEALEVLHLPEHLPPNLPRFTCLRGDTQNPYLIVKELSKEQKWSGRNRSSFLHLSFVPLGRRLVIVSDF